MMSLAQFVDLLLGIYSLTSSDLRHNAVAVARDALESNTEHLVHLAVRLGSLEETYAAIIGVADELGEFILTEFALHASAHRSGAKR